MKNEEKLHTLRKQKGITQAELAEIMDVSRQAVSRWESGVVTPSIENLKRLSSLYGVPLASAIRMAVGMSRWPSS